MKRLLLILLFFPTFLRAQIIVTAFGPVNVSGITFVPCVLVLDDSGNMYITDYYNHLVVKASPAYQGAVTLIAGTGAWGYSGDGGLGIHAALDVPDAIAVDHHGNVYIADDGNNRIRKITPNDSITTIAGTGTAGYNGDHIPATAAQLYYPDGIAIDDAGNIYIND